MANEMESDFYVENAAILDVEETDASSAGPEPGTYEVVVSSVEHTASKDRNIPGYTVIYEVVANADGSETAMSGRRAFARYYSPPRPESRGDKWMLGRLKKFLAVTGVEINSRGGYNAAQAIGAHIIIEIFQDTYKDVDQDGNEVVKYSSKVRGEERIADADGDVVRDAPPPPAPATSAGRGKATSQAAPTTSRSRDNGQSAAPPPPAPSTGRGRRSQARE